MKKIIYLLPFLFFGLLACDDDEMTMNPDPTEEPEIPDSNIITPKHPLLIHWDSIILADVSSGKPVPPNLDTTSFSLWLYKGHHIWAGAYTFVGCDDPDYQLVEIEGNRARINGSTPWLPLESYSSNSYFYHLNDYYGIGFHGGFEYFPCNDSISYFRVHTAYNHVEYTYGVLNPSDSCPKPAPYGKVDDDLSQGPHNKINSFSKNLHYYHETDYSPYIIIDSANYEIEIRNDYYQFIFKLPLDSDFNIENGEYFANPPTLNDKSLIYHSYNDGSIKIHKDSSSIYTINISLKACTGMNYTGYYKGTIPVY